MKSLPKISLPADTLRQYQKRALRDIGRAFERFRRVLFVEFMGTGKTVTAVAFVRSFVANGGRVLFLAHRGEILKQTYRKILRAGIPASMVGIIWSDHDGLNLDAPVQVASVQTIAKRKKPIEGITLVVVDEAHHSQAASWKTILGWYPKAKILGLTATPERLDGKPLGEFFDEMVLGEMSEILIANEWLAKPEIWTREDHWRPKKLRKRGGDYNPNDAARAMSGSSIVGGIPKAWKKHARWLPTVLFAATKKQARMLCTAFLRAGVKAETLFGDDSEQEREAKLARLKSGKTKVLCTCDVLGEGWDYDGCRVVIMARPTASLARFMQWAGRAMRPGGVSIILDHAGNFWVHGSPWEDRAWSLTSSPPKSLRVPRADAEGRVSFLEPREVNGKLVRADEVERQTVCAGLNGQCPSNSKPHRRAFLPNRIRLRNGNPWVCKICSARKNIRAATEAYRRKWAGMTPEQRKAQSRNAHDASQKALDAMTPDQKKERTRLAIEGSRKKWAAMTQKQKSERLKNAWSARRSR